ncbi:EAL domain-containing protein [Methylophilus flavus]|uniref:EAL domain-containing protein n=1 Tax=Methylophilus flavus TaxID=640084 RepID=A0ABW3P9T5_9PROT
MSIDNRSADDFIRPNHQNLAPALDESILNNALENNQFALFYQPQIDLPTGEVIGLEGLLRWRHPEQGMKLPETFIAVAEETGQIAQLTRLVIDTGFKFIEKLDSDLSFSFNVSARCIRDNHLLHTLDSSCHTFHIDPHRIVLEFAETATAENPAHAEGILGQLRTNGFRLGIDDAGNGYYTVSELRKLPFSELKIDKSLVTTMQSSSKSRKSIVSAIELADSLGITTFAAGIENHLEAIGLRELGCQYGQGFYFARPMDEADTLTWLENWNKHPGLPV